MKFVHKFSRNAKVSYRLFAVHLALSLLQQELEERNSGRGTYLEEMEVEMAKEQKTSSRSPQKQPDELDDMYFIGKQF